MDDNFVSKFVVAARIELWNGYRLALISGDDWNLKDNDGYLILAGTLEECVNYYLAEGLNR